VPIVLKSGNLTLLEASGPVQACNGIALPQGNSEYKSKNYAKCCLILNEYKVFAFFFVFYMCVLVIVGVVKSRQMRWAGHVARMGEDRGVYRVLVGKPEGKRPLGRPRRRWEDNIKMNLQEVGEGRRDWMELAQDRDRWRALVGTVRDFRVS